MDDVQIFGVSVVGTIVAIVTLCKETGFPGKYCPLLSLFLGALVGIFILHPNDLQEGIVTGLAVGLSATGVYSAVKNVKQGVQPDRAKPTDTQ